MDIIYSPDHLLHQSPGELLYSDFVPAFEKPERAELILGAVRDAEIGPLYLEHAGDAGGSGAEDAGWQAGLLQF